MKHVRGRPLFLVCHTAGQCDCTRRRMCMASGLELEVSLTTRDGDGGATLMTRHALLTRYLCFYIHRLEPPTPGTRRRSGRGGGARLRSPPSSWPSLPAPRSPSWPPVQSQGPITAVRACAWVSPRDIRVRLGCASNLAGPCAQLRTPAPARATRRRRAANRPSSSHPCPSPVTPGVSRSLSVNLLCP